MANLRRVGALAASLVLLASSLAQGAETPRVNGMNRVTGEKLDSGLGPLPPYRSWAPLTATSELAALYVPVRVAGESLDSGLGSLPHYRDWALFPATSKWASRHRFAIVPGEKIDSGLGDLPQYHADRH